MEKAKKVNSRCLEIAITAIVLLVIGYYCAWLIPSTLNIDRLRNWCMVTAATNGLKPYTEISMLQMSFWLYPAVLFCKIFGTGFYCSVVLEGLILSTIGMLEFVLTRKIFSFCKHKKISELHILHSFAIPLTIAIFAVTIQIFSDSLYSYNTLMQIVLLLGFWIVLKIEEQSQNGATSLNLLMITAGLLYGLPVTFKQSSGIVIFACYFAFCVYAIFSKREAKESKKAWLLSLISLFVPISAFLIQTAINNAFAEFYDYTIAGAGSFLNNFKIDFTFWLVFWATILVAMGVLFLISIFKKQLSLIIVAGGFCSFAFVSNIIPLIESERIMMGVIVSFPVFLYIACLNGRKTETIDACLDKEKRKKKKDKIAIVYMVISILLTFVSIASANLQGEVAYDDITVAEEGIYKGTRISASLLNELDYFCGEMERLEEAGYEVHLAFGNASFFSLAFERYDKDYDIFLKGNIGTKTAEALLNEAEDNAVFITYYQGVAESNAGNIWQEPLEYEEYIRENCEQIYSKSFDNDLFGIWAK